MYARQTVPGVLYLIMLMLQDSLVEHFPNTKPLSVVWYSQQKCIDFCSSHTQCV